jgi:hypothetical protein
MLKIAICCDNFISTTRIRTLDKLNLSAYGFKLKPISGHDRVDANNCGSLDIFAHNIAIKRFCDKKGKRHFSSNIFFNYAVATI